MRFSVYDLGRSACIVVAEVALTACESSEVEGFVGKVGVVFAAEGRVGDDFEDVFDASAHTASRDADVLAVGEEALVVACVDVECCLVGYGEVEVSAVFGSVLDELSEGASDVLGFGCGSDFF